MLEDPGPLALWEPARRESCEHGTPCVSASFSVEDDGAADWLAEVEARDARARGAMATADTCDAAPPAHSPQVHRGRPGGKGLGEHK